jgi:hypothetical protein
MKTFIVGDIYYFPIFNISENKSKYIQGSSSGIVFLDEIYTEDELVNMHGKELKVLDKLMVCLKAD